MKNHYYYIILTGYNDVDHTLPYADFLSEKDPHSEHFIVLLQASRKNFRVDQLLRSLTKRNIHSTEIFSTWYFRFLAHLFFQLEKVSNHQFFHKFFSTLKKIILNMDHPSLDKLRLSQAKNFFITCHGDFNEKINRSIQSAKDKKTFFFPHGFPLCVNGLLTVKQLTPLHQHEENKLDVKIVTDKFNSGKNTVRLNSLRFSPQWVQWKISHEKPFEWKLNSKLKIAVIFPKDDINTFTSEVWRTCQVALQFPSCSVAVSHRGTYLPKEVPKEVKNSERFCWPSPDVSTISILNWADIVIHNGTTLHADCILLDKVVIVPKYLSCNKTYCETYGSALIAETRDDLYYFFKAAADNFEKFKKEKHLPLRENNHKFMNDFFHVDDPQLDNWLSLFENINEKR